LNFDPISSSRTVNGTIKENLIGRELAELEELFTTLGEQPYRARQLMLWMYRRKCRDFQEMTDLSLSLRMKLQRVGEIYLPAIERVTESRDGSLKYLFRLRDNYAIEGVLIPDQKRTTLCISTQVGCPLGCIFCRTALAGFHRQLTRSEIVGQVLAVQHSTTHSITNLVFMGMGEPLLNSEEVFSAIRILIAEEGSQFAKRHITISTAGIISEISKVFKDPVKDIGLAVSLNAATDELRSRLMPLNDKYPLVDLMNECKLHARKTRRRITFEYVLIKGINDRVDDRKALVKLLRGFPCKVNLIPFNSFPGTHFKRPDRERIEEFQDYLFNKLNVTVMVRDSRGSDIAGACGQLANIDADTRS
jgi:23S rRNA (adenine2503-C2)-methyltransferase